MVNHHWQKEKDNLIKILENKIFENRERVCYAELKEINLPAILLPIFRNHAERIFNRDKPIRIQAIHRFNLSHPDLQKYIKNLRERLIDHFYLNADECQKIIRFGVTFALNLIICPSQTLENALYQKSSERTRAEIFTMIHTLDRDLPLLGSLLEYFSNEKERKISGAHFGEILNEIKTSIYSENPIIAILSELKILSNFYQQITGEKKETFPIEMIQAMLLDRGLENFTNSLLQESQGKQDWSLEQIQQFMERFILVGQLEASSQPKTGDIIYTEEFNPEAFSTHEQNEAVPDMNNNIRTEENPRSEAERLPESNSTHSEPNPETREKENLMPKPDTQSSINGRRQSNEPNMTIMQKDSTESAPENENFGAEENINRNGVSFRVIRGKKRPSDYSDELELVIHRDKIEEQPPGPYPSLYTFIDIKSRKVFIKKIFFNDEEAFSQFVERVDRAESWKEAKAILDAELASRNVNAYSRSAIKLSDFLFSRYFSRNRY